MSEARQLTRQALELSTAAEIEVLVRAHMAERFPVEILKGA